MIITDKYGDTITVGIGATGINVSTICGNGIASVVLTNQQTKELRKELKRLERKHQGEDPDNGTDALELDLANPKREAMLDLAAWYELQARTLRRKTASLLD